MTSKAFVNSSSSIISVEENDLLFELLGARCQSVGTAVVQVFFAKKDTNYQTWKKQYVGVACLVKDMVKRSFYIRTYDLSTYQMLWQQEIYRSFEYTMLQPFFHVFEAEDSYVAFNFADEDEAEEFFATVHSKTKNMTRKTPTSSVNIKNPLNASQDSQQTMPSSPSIGPIHNVTNAMNNKPSKKKICRADIDFLKTHPDDIDKSMRQEEVQPISPQTFEKSSPTRPFPKIPVEARNPVTRSPRMALELQKPPESPSKSVRAPPPPPSVPAPFNPSPPPLPPSNRQSETNLDSDDGRNALLADIQKFKHGQQLKPNRERKINVPGPAGDVASEIANALKKKFEVVASLSYEDNVDEEERID